MAKELRMFSNIANYGLIIAIVILLLGASAAACDPVKVDTVGWCVYANDYDRFPTCEFKTYDEALYWAEYRSGFNYMILSVKPILDTVKVDDGDQIVKMSEFPGLSLPCTIKTVDTPPPSFIVRVDTTIIVGGFTVCAVYGCGCIAFADTTFIYDTIWAPKVPVLLDSAEYKTLIELLHPTISKDGWYPAIDYDR